MNALKRIALLILCLIMPFSLVACENNEDARSIVSIEKTSSVGLKDIYAITYTDGTTSTFEITNGASGLDGEDGKDLDINDLFNKYLQSHPTATYEDFLREVVVVNPNLNSVSANKALLSSAKIYTEFTVNYMINPFQTATDTSISCGSAVIYKIENDYTYFITNYHVVYNHSALESDKLPKRINLYLYGSESAPIKTGEVDSDGYSLYDYGSYALSGEYVGGSLTYDIALIKVPTSEVLSINDKVSAVTFADEYYVGQTAIAVGNPEDEGLSVTQGIISIDDEYISLALDGTARAYRSMRIDTAIYSGSSGGGLFNSKGELIGITNAGDGTDQNVNYAIPLPVVKGVVQNIEYYAMQGLKSGKRITLGVTVIGKNAKYIYDATLGYGKVKEELEVNTITSGSIIEKLGLSSGNILKSFTKNGNVYNLNRSFDIGDFLLTVKSGDIITATFFNGTETVTGNAYTVLESDLTVLA
ncbi:MAG: trypsin-like peptidase domain-containing protein [Clostridia bacterium]|nr:trypsin-like peptidase domain-containing protein [Clostridia bacterium]